MGVDGRAECGQGSGRNSDPVFWAQRPDPAKCSEDGGPNKEACGQDPAGH